VRKFGEFIGSDPYSPQDAIDGASPGRPGHRQSPRMSASDPADAPCPCGRPLRYAACCGRWHEGALRGLAPTAEDLMRSRYTAYVQDRLDYLHETWHPSTRPASLEPNPPGLRWLGLEVQRHAAIDADHALVAFVARSKLGGRAHRMHECSRFVREDGRWFYVDGDLS
jgi:SEC-C motif-containing protein